METVKREENGKQRDARGRFTAGNSGGGRKKQPPEFRECAVKNAYSALEVVIAIMRDNEASNADRIKAASIVMERAYGKPDSTVRVETPDYSALDAAFALLEVNVCDGAGESREAGR